MGQLTPLEYRQTRACIRDAASRALDEIDAVQHALSYGDPGAAREHARLLAMTADDITALLERIVRRYTYEAPR